MAGGARRVGALMAGRVVAVGREPDEWVGWGRSAEPVERGMQIGCRPGESGGWQSGGERAGGASGSRASAWSSRCERTGYPKGTGTGRGAGASGCGGSQQSWGGVVRGP